MMKSSKIITFIGGFYVFGGIVVLLSLIFGGSALNTTFDVPNIPDYVVKLLTGILSILIGFLYVKRVKISYWFVLIFSIIFFSISATLTKKLNTQPYIGNMIYSLFVIIMTVIKRKEFCNSIKTILKKEY